MTEINIYFNDLAETVQEELWRKVTKDLLDNGEVSQKGRHESEEEFQRRLDEETDHYINCNNFANRFII